MNLFGKLKLGMKISIGFAMILGLLIIAIMVSLFSLNNLNTHFTQYAEISTNEMLVGRIQANLLETRLAAENFIQFGEDSQKELFESRFYKMEGFIFELKSSMNNPEVQKIMEQILERSREYKNDFNKIVEGDKKRSVLYNVLASRGPEIEQNLLQLLESAHLKKDAALIYGTGNAMRHLLTARLQVSRFLELNEMDRVKNVVEDFAKMDEWITFLKNVSDSEDEKRLLDLIQTSKEIYAEHFTQIVSVIEDRNKAISHLDQIGPEVSAIAEEIKLFIIEEQAAYKPKIIKEYRVMVTRMIILSLLALFLAIIIALGIIRIVIFPVKTVTNTFKEISEGEANLNVRLKVSSEDELGEMAKFFNTFMEKLQIIIGENNNQSWLKTGQAELSERMSKEQDMKMLCGNIISYIAVYLNVPIGRVYIRNENDSYELQGVYAYKKSKNFLEVISLGEGLIGQAALEKQKILLSNIPEDYLKISSGVGEAKPKSIIVVPCLLNDKVVGVIELGTFQGFTPIQLKFLDEVSEMIAINISSLQAHLKTEELLQKTLIQSEELQVQQEELRQSNEEFEEQTRSLRESEERLQEQQEELRVINEELVAHARNLEIQKNDINKKNEHLLMAQKEIQEKAEAVEIANKYKSEFLANMSHELRTPLNSILVLSELLARKKDLEPLTQKQLEFASTIHTSGSELLRLINDILDLSKIEVGKMEVHLEPMSFKELAYTMDKNFRQIAENKGLDFNIIIDKTLPEAIITDSHKVRQIANNLLSNAFKFTEKGSVSLEILYPNKEILGDVPIDKHKCIAIAVSDTGIGVQTEKQSVIFEAFKQSDGTISRKYGGTGLGLSITKELAALLGGSIHLVSEADKGSTFTLILPLETHATGAEENNVSEEVTDGQEYANSLEEELISDVNTGTRAEKILLIIEDDYHFAHVLEELAVEKGYKCITAENGARGIEQARVHKPDAILLDIGLPDINGWEVIEKLRNECEIDIPIHIISGSDALNISQQADAIIGYMQKPLSIENINKVFNTIEAVTTKKFKKLLMLGIDDDVKQSIDEIIDKKHIMISSTDKGNEAIHLLKTEGYDCIILDLNLKDMSGFNFLKQLADEMTLHIPIIIYTENDLTQDEAGALQKYAKSIIVKGTKSMDRLTSEVNLFLNTLNTAENVQKARMVRTAEEKEEALRGKKILIVDDDMRNVFALSSILEEKGIKIVVGRNGKEGIDKLSEHADIDLVLMDIMMPEMDGYTAMQQIRKRRAYAKIPIIALTAKAMKEDRQKCIESGANDYLTKPIQINRLISLLRVWLYK
ncbi:response regulator [Cellulosilyticum sp. I15G10I2]|uniref:response regulator n=1 Tax=Cellulosilyticum sp. I15G10I2 TaxID=1892843 RepID=UPI00085CC374|nr:response regulator [Cellulosilyticum sp. I15G10I2]